MSITCHSITHFRFVKFKYLKSPPSSLFHSEVFANCAPHFIDAINFNFNKVRKLHLWEKYNRMQLNVAGFVIMALFLSLFPFLMSQPFVMRNHLNYTYSTANKVYVFARAFGLNIDYFATSHFNDILKCDACAAVVYCDRLYGDQLKCWLRYQSKAQQSIHPKWTTSQRIQRNFHLFTSYLILFCLVLFCFFFCRFLKTFSAKLSSFVVAVFADVVVIM